MNFHDPCCRNPIQCQDIGCCDPVYCPPPKIHPKRKKPKCCEVPCNPCEIMKCFPGNNPLACCPCGPPPPCPGLPCLPMGNSCESANSCGDENTCSPQGDFCNAAAVMKQRPGGGGGGGCCFPEPDCHVYRCCEPMSSSYAGHIPGFTFHSNGRTTGKVTWGTRQYMDKCLYFNTFQKP